MLSELDLYLFREGRHRRLADVLGAHPVDGGVRFGVWAPGARRVSVIGDFCGWSPDAWPMVLAPEGGVWRAEVPGVRPGDRYKFHIESASGYRVDKADPLARWSEPHPGRASVVWQSSHRWGDDAWMRGRAARHERTAPLSIYEVHLGSWRREGGQHLSYRQLAPLLAEHATRLGFTHVELMPVMEHPFYGSWGYQVTGYFAPTSRYGSPDDLAALVDTLHQANLGVIFDWVPSHFPADEHGLGYFDGTHLYEHPDPREGYHQDWKSLIFHYARGEVRSFLLSSALHWLREFHADGLRVDAVASMLYRDYSRQPGEWVPNEHGGREHLDAIALLRDLNQAAAEDHPDALVIAEESTSWPLVTRGAHLGGLGFSYKWDMGWMHDTLDYLANDPVHRSFHHRKTTFRQLYAASENFLLPLSHDEVVHGKGSLLGKMPGDDWQRRANLRLLLASQTAQTGKKLLFMGAELATPREWSHDGELDWALLDDPHHAGVAALLRDLNNLYTTLPAMHEGDCEPGGLEWVDCNDTKNSVISFLRRGSTAREQVLCAFNFTPVPRHGYTLGVPYGGRWREVLSTDAVAYGGSGQGNLGGVDARAAATHGRDFSIDVTLPPLGAVFFLGERPDLVAAPVAPPPAAPRPSGPYAQPEDAPLVPLPGDE
ncbi:MAG: 1,4-alpha-glucan branching protein GlgB [Polyangiaceae bacterium]|nr:1,4-alpha-glucan branching protein GlgB [Polyangiaceae bacterium]